MFEQGGSGPPRLEHDVNELYEHAPCAHLSTLPDGTIVRANQTFFSWIRLSAEDVLGRTRLQNLLTIGSRMYYETHYAPLLTMQGMVNEIALDIRRPDGTVCPVVASARQVREADGKVLVNRVALFDSTDRRRYEQELLVARRRAEQSAIELADADRQKNDFIATLAHELRNPLAPIRTAVEILRRLDLSNENARRATDVLQRQVSQLARLVDDLLDVSRIGQDKLTLLRVPVDLVSIVQHAIEGSEPLLKDAGIALHVRPPATPIHVEADSARLVQVIANILNNAAKFTPRGGSVTLTVECVETDAVIRIRDTGIGIDAAHLPRIFDLFVQVQDADDRRGGIGVGLMLAKTLVERHGGSISASSDGPGQGAEFVIRLPTSARPPAGPA